MRLILLVLINILGNISYHRMMLENQKIRIIDDISQHFININYTQSIILLLFAIIF